MTNKQQNDVRRLVPDKVLVAATIALLAWAPLPLASNRLWSMSLLAIGAAVLLILLTVDTWREGHRVSMPSRLTIPAALFGIVILWSFFQWTPWTPAFLHHPIWALAAENLNEEISSRITVNPSATLQAAAKMMGYGALFWVAFNLGAKRKWAFTFIKAVTLIAGTYAWYGLGVFVAGNDTLLIYEKWEYPNALTSTFVNANSFATYAGIGLVCASALILRAIVPVLRSDARTQVKISQAVEIALKSHGVYVFSALGLFFALMLTASRAGIASAFVALVFLFFLMIRSRRMRLGKAVKISAAALGVLILFALPLSGLLADRAARADVVLTENARFDVYRLTLTAISDTPILGTGYGTFADVFPTYRDSTIFTPSYWVKAHSTYLETLLELGVPVGLALIVAVAWVAYLCFQDALQRRRFRAPPASAAAIVLLAALHSTIDFSLQIPAIAATVSVLLGASLGLCTTLEKDRNRPALDA